MLTIPSEARIGEPNRHDAERNAGLASAAVESKKFAAIWAASLGTRTVG